jgi:hypothetical protein
MKRHIIWMIIGCGLPLLLIFFAPALGLGSNASLFIFILAMFACHLLMPMPHGRPEHNKSETNKAQSHELHPH